jgi:hypothetical protein
MKQRENIYELQNAIKICQEHLFSRNGEIPPDDKKSQNTDTYNESGRENQHQRNVMDEINENTQENLNEDSLQQQLINQVHPVIQRNNHMRAYIAKEMIQE